MRNRTNPDNPANPQQTPTSTPCRPQVRRVVLVGVLLRIVAPLPHLCGLGATVGDPLFNHRSRPANKRTKFDRPRHSAGIGKPANVSRRTTEIVICDVINRQHRPPATVSDRIGVCGLVGHGLSLWSGVRQAPSRLVTVSARHTQTTNRTTGPQTRNTETPCFVERETAEKLSEWSDLVRFLQIRPPDNRTAGGFWTAFLESDTAVVQILRERFACGRCVALRCFLSVIPIAFSRGLNSNSLPPSSLARD